MLRKVLAVSAVTFGAALVAQSAFAQGGYPSRPLRLIVPAAPGGGTDYTGRTIAQKLTEALGQTVVVENRPGGAGNIGVEIAARSNADGHTLVMPITSFPMNPHLYRKLPFDTVKDFAPIVLASVAPLYLVVNPSVPAKSVSDLIALAKAKPGQLNYANSGNGTSAHLAGELFKKMAGVDLVSIPYKGGGPAVIDLVAGRVHLYFSTIPAALAQVQAGKLRGLAVTSAKRVSLIPDVPTVAESGLPGFEIVGWFGIFAPAGTPKPVISRLNREINDVLRMPDIQKRFASQGLVPGGGSPEELGKFLRSEIAKWGALIKQIGLEPQ
ncbi:MAG TPA: tripartite tricarboxylate transporter substrate binding protein [Burkholderiales bacterium]|nr:tripartite tricarboxylate transporter substrate binding protein [Burkholderiales bacterium]